MKRIGIKICLISFESKFGLALISILISIMKNINNRLFSMFICIKSHFSGIYLLSLWYICTLLLKLAYECNLRSFLLLPKMGQMIDSDADALKYASRIYLQVNPYVYSLDDRR